MFPFQGMYRTHPPENNQEDNPNEGLPVPGEDYHHLVSTLPLEQGMFPLRLRKYQGVWMLEKSVAGIMNTQRHFKARPTDIILVPYPKSGTTWLKALAFATMTRTRHSFANHPLRDLNPHECMPHLEVDAHCLESLSEIDAMNGPRLLATQMPFPMLPESIKTSGCRLVYICRDPKDVVVSRWYFNSKLQVDIGTNENVPFRTIFDMFCDGICPAGSIWDHALGYWTESLRAPERVLFLKYEEILEDPMGKLTSLAEFMGCSFTKEEVMAGVPAEIVSLCSFRNLRYLAVEQNRRIGPSKLYTAESFYRKGTAGDWSNHLSTEMAQRMDQITQEKLQGTGLALGRSSSEITTMDA